MVCPSCSRANREGRAYCAECGHPLAAACAACGFANEPGARFCGRCGAACVVSSVAPPDDERRQLTVVFCDLVGSTALAAAMDPEEWQAILERYRRLATETVGRFRGHVAQHLGDGLLVYFGWPGASEDDPERAILAALELVETAGEADARLSVRVGIHTGLVVIGGSTDALAIGEAPNVAARVQALAEPGTVLVSGATHRLVPGRFLVEPFGPRALKGVTQPLEVFRVLRPSGVRSRLAAAAAARGLTPFVGRTSERRLLRERFDRACAGEGQVVLVTGEPGIGKSRLVQVLRADVAGVPHTWIETSASPQFTNTPLHPVIEMMRQGFSRRAPESVETRLARLERALERVGVEVSVVLPLVAPLLGLPVPVSVPPAPAPPESVRRRLQEAIVQWALRAARLQPVVLLLEDLQWADPSTLEIQQMIEERAAAEPILLLYTARAEFRPPWPLRAHHAQIVLSRLGPRETRELVLGSAGQVLAPDVIDRVAGRSDGIPLHVEEITRAVVEAGEDPGREVPATLHDSLMARLDRLGTHAKQAAQVGAVLGREFSWRLLESMEVLPATALDSALAALDEAELVYLRGKPPDATVHFKHALVQDAAYASLLKSRRRELHGRAARLLAGNVGEGADAPPELLARHLEEAGETRPAVAAWKRAGQFALSRGAEREAAGHLRHALTVLASLPPGPDRDAQELSIQLALGQALMLNKGWGSPEAADAYDRAHRLADEATTKPRDLVVLLVGLWNSKVNREGPALAEPVADELLALAERSGLHAARIWAHFAKGVTAFQRGRLAEGREHLLRTVGLAEEKTIRSAPIDPRLSALGFAILATAQLGLVAEAQELCAQALQLGARSSRPNERAWAETYATLLHELLGDPEAVRRHSARTIASCAEEPFPVHETSARIHDAWARSALGEDTVAAMETAIADFRATGARLKSEFHRGLYADVLVRAGRVERALAVLAEAEGMFPGDDEHRAETLRRRAELLAHRGADPQTVEQTFRAALEVARGQGARLFELRSAVRFGRWLREAGRDAEAREIVAPVLATFDPDLELPDRAEAAALLAALEQPAA